MRIGSREVAITNREKVFFPALGLTKGDLVDYYLDLAPQVLGHVARRPMLLKRYPNGVGGEFFYQKRIPVPHPDWMRSAHIDFPSGRTADYPVVTDAASLVWIANLGCIELHTWPTRLEHPERPDYLLIDLDPGPGHPWEHVREIALAVGQVLDGLDMRGYPKTSGSTGLHVLAPIRPELEFPEVRRFAKALAERVEKAVPDISTTTWRVAERDGVFIDYGQNARDHAIAAAYSVRPTPDARVSAPLRWDEVATVEPERFTLRTMRERIATSGDPSAGMWRRKVSLLGRFERVGLDTPDPDDPPRHRARRRWPGPPGSGTGRRQDDPSG
ncbi:MAG: non-homologous end-joining DNA ligase [Gaiellales bacterium]